MSDSDFLRSVSMQSLDIPERMGLAEWAEKFRVLGLTTGRKGAYTFDLVPYLREPMGFLSPKSDKKKVVVCKTPQEGWSELAITWLLYIIDQDPAPTYYYLPTELVGRDFSKLKLDPAIKDHPRILKMITESVSNRDTNTLMRKEFPGGTISIMSAQSEGAFRFAGVRNIILDEYELFPHSPGGEGDPVSQTLTRQKTFFNRKTLIISTATINDESQKSLIWEQFERGDRREWFMACPHCREFQVFNSDMLKFDKPKNAPLRFFGMTCQKCGEVIHERHQSACVSGGEWRPTCENPEEPDTVSYHQSAFMSNFMSWKEIAEHKFKATKDGRAEIWYRNNIDGLPSERVSIKIRAKAMMAAREKYPENHLPSGLAFITAGVDVQKDRIEVSFVGWGLGWESWHISHDVIHAVNSPNDIGDLCWVQLENLLFNQTWTLAIGKTVGIERAFIDCGYATPAVFRFCKMFGVHAVRGYTSGMITEAREGHGKKMPILRIGVNYFKGVFFDSLQTREPGPGFCHFPMWADQLELYNQLLSEIPVRKGQKIIYEKIRERNEALDVRIYAMAAAQLFGIHRWDEDMVSQYYNSLP